MRWLVFGIALGIAFLFFIAPNLGILLDQWRLPPAPQRVEQPAPVNPDAPKYAYIHKPASGCPAGYWDVGLFFVEKDGSYEAACISPEAMKPPSGVIAVMSFDVLKPGERCCIAPDHSKVRF